MFLIFEIYKKLINNIIFCALSLIVIQNKTILIFNVKCSVLQEKNTVTSKTIKTKETIMYTLPVN